MLKPVEDKVVIKIEKSAETKTESGLILTATNEEKPNQGTVVAVGPGIVLQDGTRVVPELSVGDTVVFAKYSGNEVTVDGQDYLILAYRDIFAVLGNVEA